ncbi:MAG: membrane associated rhomboid family serine protease, partial [Paracoccaceae bacterium]
FGSGTVLRYCGNCSPSPMPIPIFPIALPVGDSPNVRATPVVTWTLLALHVMVFLVAVLPTMSDGARVDARLAAQWRQEVQKAPTPEALVKREAMTVEERKMADDVERFSTPRMRADPDVVFLFGSGYRPGSLLFYKLFTSLFLHASLLAMGFHLLLLWILGDNVEHHVGRLYFLGLYVGGGAFGGLLGSHLSLVGSTLPVLASTSALGAVLGAYYVFFRYNEIQVVYVGRLAWRPATAGTQFIKARIILPVLTMAAAILGHMSFGVRGATWAGVVAGVGAALILHKQFGVSESEDSDTWYPDPLRVTTDPVARIEDLLAKDRDGEAAQVYLENRRRPGFELEGAPLDRVAEYLADHGMVALAAAARKDLQR